MARSEHDREDLLKEATALFQRAELQVAGFDAPMVVGFRRDGSFSAFFGSDPVYQFNSASQLRRAYAAGLLYKAVRGQLVALRRERTATETVLMRRQLSPEQESAFLVDARGRLQNLMQALQAQQFKLIGQAPLEADVTGRVHQWLADLPDQLVVANTPNAG